MGKSHRPRAQISMSDIGALLGVIYQFTDSSVCSRQIAQCFQWPFLQLNGENGFFSFLDFQMRDFNSPSATIRAGSRHQNSYPLAHAECWRGILFISEN